MSTERVKTSVSGSGLSQVEPPPTERRAVRGGSSVPALPLSLSFAILLLTALLSIQHLTGFAARFCFPFIAAKMSAHAGTIYPFP